MRDDKQLWLLAGGNGAGKSTFYRLFLEPPGLIFVNADLIARQIGPSDSPRDGYQAARIAERFRSDLLNQGVSFCYETMFSHTSKVDFVARARALGYRIVLVYIHLSTPQLNEARVLQRVSEGGHPVPRDKILGRLPRTMKNVAAALPLADEAWLLDNSSAAEPFVQVAKVSRGKKTILTSPLPSWASQILGDIP